MQQLEADVAAQWHPEKNGDLLASDVGKWSAKRAWWRCTRGHEWETRIYERTRRGCPRCVFIDTTLAESSPELAKEYEIGNEFAADQIGRGSDRLVWWRGPCGHRWQASVNNRVNRGSGCPYCAGKLPTEKTSLKALNPDIASQWDSEKNAGTPSDVTPGSRLKVWWRCKDGHSWDATVIDRKRFGCPGCARTHSGLEKLAETLLGTTKYNRCPLRTSKKKYRPDLQLSETVFVNVDGLYWHSEAQKPKDYHRKLREAFEAEGLRIMQFYDDEIRQRSAIVRSMVKAALGSTDGRIWARQCLVQPISTDEASGFLATNHIMGPTSLSRYLGLRNAEGVLVQVIGFQAGKAGIHITRSAGLLNTVVVGGFQRLLAAIRRQHPKMSITTMVDLRYATGHSLEKAGFRRVTTRYSYCYTNGYVRKDKRCFRVKAGVDEVAEAVKQHFHRLWDAGKAVYVLDGAEG